MAVNFQWCNIWPNRVLSVDWCETVVSIAGPLCAVLCACHGENIVGVHRGHNFQTGTRSSRSSNSTLFSLYLSLSLSSQPCYIFVSLFCSAAAAVNCCCCVSAISCVVCSSLYTLCVEECCATVSTCLSPLRLFLFCFVFLFKIFKNFGKRNFISFLCSGVGGIIAGLVSRHHEPGRRLYIRIYSTIVNWIVQMHFIFIMKWRSEWVVMQRPLMGSQFVFLLSTAGKKKTSSGCDFLTQ